MYNSILRRFLVFITVLAASLTLQPAFAKGTPNKQTFFQYLKVSDVPAKQGTTIGISTQLKYINPGNRQPRALADKWVVFSVNGAQIGASKTDKNGVAGTRWSIPGNFLGSSAKRNVTIKVTFAPEYEYRGKTRSGTLTVIR